MIFAKQPVMSGSRRMHGPVETGMFPTICRFQQKHSIAAKNTQAAANADIDLLGIAKVTIL
jgi:hypothetical protein